MKFSFALPMISDSTDSCSELTGDDPYLLCCKNEIVGTPSPLTLKKASARASGMTALLSPTGELMHTRLEDLGLDDSFSELNEKISETVISCAEGLPVGGVVFENDRIKEEYGKSVFESAYFDHLEKITVLKDAGVSFILLQNFDKLWDMRAGVLAAKAADMPVFVLMTVDEDGKTEGDADYVAALITLQALGADAFGIHCKNGSECTARLIKRIFPHAEIPLICADDFSSYSDDKIALLAENGTSVWIDTSEAPDKNKLDLIKRLGSKFDESSEKDSYAAATFREAFFLPENIELSEPVPCGYDMSDELIDLDDSSCNAIYLILKSTDDAANIALNAEMSYLPFVVHASDPTTLEAALRYYQGRLIVDGRCGIEKEKFKALTQKYGAIIY